LAKDDGTERPPVDAATVLLLHAFAKGLHDLAVGLGAGRVGLMAQQIRIDLHRAQLLLQVCRDRRLACWTSLVSI
jgi:hypothetical protein